MRTARTVFYVVDPGLICLGTADPRIGIGSRPATVSTTTTAAAASPCAWTELSAVTSTLRAKRR